MRPLGFVYIRLYFGIAQKSPSNIHKKELAADSIDI